MGRIIFSFVAFSFHSSLCYVLFNIGHSHHDSLSPGYRRVRLADHRNHQNHPHGARLHPAPGQEEQEQSIRVHHDVSAVLHVVPREDHEVHQQTCVHHHGHLWSRLLPQCGQGVLVAAQVNTRCSLLFASSYLLIVLFCVAIQHYIFTTNTTVLFFHPCLLFFYLETSCALPP